MESLRDRLTGKWGPVIIAGIVGLAIGLLYAWVIDPVEFIDATPLHLREDLRQDYLRMVIESYAVNQNIDEALERYRRLGPYAKETLEQVGANPGYLSSTAVQNFRAAVEIFGPDLPEAQEEGSAAAAGFGFLGVIPYLCGGVVLIAVLVVGGLGVRRFLLARQEAQGMEAYPEAQFTAEDMDRRLDASLGGAPLGAIPETEQPLATFRTIYKIGDDLYDDSFSIESPTGDFLGECGVGIGDFIGTGEPKKVSSFEVWLFDKNDIQTVTKVLMSRYAYDNEETRTRLSAKGDPVLAENGGIIELETASLRVEARIVDMTYGEGALPAESFFEKLAIEVKAWQKPIPFD
jgi:hypothetical protein